MAEKTYHTDYGDVIVRNAMFDIDGTTLEEGVEVKNPDNDLLVEINGYRDVEEFTIDELEEIIENNL